MNASSGWKLFGMCLVAAVMSFIIWSVYFPSMQGVLALAMAIVIFAVLSLVDGYRNSA
ncbi:hypothetical protein [Haladaptatus sp. NG-WS-4]